MACATPLPAPEAPRDVRKTVTIVFSDVTGSTSLGERLDSESLRKVMSRYFEEMSRVLERHGATVEKFIGDAVMAVFGIPRVHEDDALRAVRATAEFSGVLPSLNDTFRRDFDIAIQTRTGVNTGEVIAGDASAGQAFVTGDTVNVAARLEQAAAPGEILIGEATYRLVHKAVIAESVEDLSVKGRSGSVAARRLIAVLPKEPTLPRQLRSPLVGRVDELAQLRRTYQESIDSGDCRVVTVLGPPGVGKSRLVDEFVGWVGDRARILRGRCLPYGEGITFWPVRGIVRQAASINDEDLAEMVGAKIEALLPATADRVLISDRLTGAMGSARSPAAIQETYWAIRRLLWTLATEAPVVVVFDDIQWGESAFLDLIEYLVAFTTDAPLFVVCLSRPELLEIRGSWGSGPREGTLRLEPLGDEATGQLMKNLLGTADLPEEVRERIFEIAEGTPLFVEEMIASLIDQGVLRRVEGVWKAVGDPFEAFVPTSLRALLDARLDRLPEDERALLQLASVIGRVFWWSAVAELQAEQPRSDVGYLLQALLRKDLIRPEDTNLTGEDAFRFRHMLIRDAAYESIPKLTRSELHERFADWLERKTGERVEEFQEILAYHLEQAYRYRGELGLQEKPHELARRAAVYLTAAGMKALGRSDAEAATRLLSRSLDLFPKDSVDRSEALLALSQAHFGRGDLRKARGLVEEAVVRARDAGDRKLEIRAELELIDLRFRTEPTLTWTDMAGELESLIDVIQHLGDDRTLGWAWRRLSTCRWVMGRATAAEEAIEQAMECAVRSHDASLERSCIQHMTTILLFGPAPAETLVRRARAILETPDIDRITESYALDVLAMHEAMVGRFDEARATASRAMDILLDLGLHFQAALEAEVSGVVEMLAGDPEAAERLLRRSAEALEAMGETGGLSTVAALLGQSLCLQGRYEEAERFALLSRESSSRDDIDSQVGWRRVLAKVLAQRGESSEAERLAREAIALAGDGEFPVMQADTLMDFAEVLARALRPRDAASSVEAALRLYEEKGDQVSASKARALLDELSRVPRRQI